MRDDDGDGERMMAMREVEVNPKTRETTTTTTTATTARELFASAFVTKPTTEEEEDSSDEEAMWTRSGFDVGEEGEEEKKDACERACPTSTLLLKKNRELDAISMKLQRTISECEKTTRRLDEREGVLLRAQESLHHDCTKFEIFARENERKMQKSLESARENKLERLVLENEVLVALRKEASSFGRRRRRCERKNRALSSVLQFLRACCEHGKNEESDRKLSVGSSSSHLESHNALNRNEGEDEDEDEMRGDRKFEDISDILFRHATLKDVNESLRARKEYASSASKRAFDGFSEQRRVIEKTIESEISAVFILREKQKEMTIKSKQEIETAKERKRKRMITEKSLALLFAAIDNLSRRCNISCPQAQKQQQQQKDRNVNVDEDEENMIVATTKFTQAHVDLEFVHSRAKVLNQIIHSSATICHNYI